MPPNISGVFQSTNQVSFNLCETRITLPYFGITSYFYKNIFNVTLSLLLNVKANYNHGNDNENVPAINVKPCYFLLRAFPPGNILPEGKRKK